LISSGILSLPLQTIINSPVNAALSIVLQLLSLSVAQCDEKTIWKEFFDESNEKHGEIIFNQLLTIYENRLNTESNDTLKLTVSNMIKSLVNLSITAKDEAIESTQINLFFFRKKIFYYFAEGFIESQIDHLKRIQTKLTLFSLQSDKCVSKVRVCSSYLNGNDGILCV